MKFGRLERIIRFVLNCFARPSFAFVVIKNVKNDCKTMFTLARSVDDLLGLYVHDVETVIV